MDNPPTKITIIHKKTKKRRIIHLISKTKEKSFKSASANCKQWVKKYGFPISIKVSYGMHFDAYGKWCEVTNWMEFENTEDLEYALQGFVKEYLE